MSVWSLFSRAVGLTMLFPRSERLNPEPYGDWQRDSVREVDIVTGCLLLIDRPLWDELGGFDERYFMYGEEADLCHRATVRGAAPVMTPEATIVHYGSASDTGNKASAVAAARITLIREHWSPLAGARRRLPLLGLRPHPPRRLRGGDEAPSRPRRACAKTRRCTPASGTTATAGSPATEHGRAPRASWRSGRLTPLPCAGKLAPRGVMGGPGGLWPPISRRVAGGGH